MYIFDAHGDAQIFNEENEKCKFTEAREGHDRNDDGNFCASEKKLTQETFDASNLNREIIEQY